MITEDGNESILEEAHRLTHGSRNADYGHPLDDYTRTAAIVSAMLAHKLKTPLTAHEMALVMVCVKLSREQNAPKRDNRTDGAGYFWVADQCLQEAARRAPEAAGSIAKVELPDDRTLIAQPTPRKSAWLCNHGDCVRPKGHPGECLGPDCEASIETS